MYCSQEINDFLLPLHFKGTLHLKVKEKLHLMFKYCTADLSPLHSQKQADFKKFHPKYQGHLYGEILEKWAKFY